jgi:hypothetical protein
MLGGNWEMNVYRVEMRNGGEPVKIVEAATIEEAKRAGDAAIAARDANFARIVDASGVEIISRRDDAPWS